MVWVFQPVSGGETGCFYFDVHLQPASLARSTERGRLVGDEVRSPGSGRARPEGLLSSSPTASGRPARPFSSSLLRAGDVQLYCLCESLTGPLVGLMVLFSPWAFGTTEAWSVWAMNIAGYGLGLLLLLKLEVRWRTGYQPDRWEYRRGTPRRLTRLMALLTLAVLLYCLVSALNARATYLPQQSRFEYHECLLWLPHSYDSRASWQALANYLALAVGFWAIRDWLLGKSGAEARVAHSPLAPASGPGAPPLPARLRWLLWLLMFNGALLGLESIVQRLAGSPRLLFLVKPLIHQTADTQFGPYAYRANGAQFFNLLWPVCLGFWWTLNRAAPRGRKRHHLLLLCGIIMAACPVISTSRGGALVTLGMAVAGFVLLLASRFLFGAHPASGRATRATQYRQSRRARWLSLCAVGGFFGAALGLGFALGWDRLEPRMRELGTGFDGREALYRIAQDMAREFPVFGTGPGTYESVSELYRPTQLINEFWPAQVHNDWLQTRITFGWVGSALLGALAVCVLLHWFSRGGLQAGRRFVWLLWLALAGCLLHARYDFPFQVYSILFLFVLLCAVLSTFSRPA